MNTSTEQQSGIKRVALTLLACVMACSVFVLAGCSSDKGSKSSQAASSSAAKSSVKTYADDELMSGKHHARLEIEGYAPITIELDADAAPISVTHFAELVNDGYYDGLTFYRVAKDFCLQGGTMGNSVSGTDPNVGKIKGEFSGNGVANELADHFDRGVVAMARTSMPDSASSTFFVTLGGADLVGTSLNGQYAAFGTISPEDMLVIDKVVADYLPNVDNTSMDSITDEAKQAKIVKIEMID